MLTTIAVTNINLSTKCGLQVYCVWLPTNKRWPSKNCNAAAGSHLLAASLLGLSSPLGVCGWSVCVRDGGCLREVKVTAAIRGTRGCPLETNQTWLTCYISCVCDRDVRLEGGGWCTTGWWFPLDSPPLILSISCLTERQVGEGGVSLGRPASPCIYHSCLTRTRWMKCRDWRAPCRGFTPTIIYPWSNQVTR